MSTIDGLRWDYPESIKLLGGFNCRLTKQQANEWHEYVIQTPEYKRYRRTLNTTRAVEAKNGDNWSYDQIVALYESLEDSREELYRIGKKWFEEHQRTAAAAKGGG